jgi:hypothetical protein
MKLRVLMAIGCAACVLSGAEPGRLEGTVRDGSDSLVPGTVISCIQEETGFRFSVVSGDRGEFHFVVPPGHYKVLARHDGFRSVAQLGVSVAPDAVRHLDFQLEPGSVTEVITVSAESTPGLFAESDGAFTIRPDELGEVPMADRTVMGALVFAPGGLVTPANNGEPGQLSILGARPNTNRYSVDGVSANNAVSGGGWPSYLPGARLPAMTALGTIHDLAVFDSIGEIRVVMQGFNAEAGRAPGGNVAVHTKSGSNDFHGSLFYSVRPSALGASDWFANQFPLAHGSPAFQDEGGTAGGPLHRDRSFFFISAERLDLRQVYSWTTTVPSVAARQLSLSLSPLLNQFPLPNGPPLSCATCFGIGELFGSSTRPAALTVASIRVDHAFSPHMRAFLRAALTPSWGESGYTQTDLSTYQNAVGVLGLTRESAEWTHDTRASFSRTSGASRWLPGPNQGSGGDFYSQFPSFAADFSSISVGGAGSIASGSNGSVRQDQVQFSHIAALRVSNHSLSMGFEYLQLRPVRTGPVSNFDVAFSSPTNLVLGPAAPLWVTYSSIQTSASRLHEISGFIQDTWRIDSRTSVTFGTRLLSVLPPRAAQGGGLFAVNALTLGYSPLAPGAPLWHDRPLVFDPTVSVAWRLSGREKTLLGNTTLRASWTAFHDGDFGVATDQLNGSPYLSLRSPQSIQIFDGINLIPVQLGFGFASNLRIPIYRRWDVTLQSLVSRHDSIAISYSGMTGSGLLRRDTVFLPTGAIGQLSFASNDGASNYNGLNLAYRRTLTRGLQSSVSYSWSHSIDLGSSDSVLFLVKPSVDGERAGANGRGPSDFDVRHNVNVTLSYTLPGKWTVSSFVSARTGFPIDVLLSETLQGSAISNDQPDLTRGVPIWVEDAHAPGGRRLNRDAFKTPKSATGNLGRNALRGFGAWQTNMALERPFRMTERLKLSFITEAFNIFNHAQFADSTRFLSSPLFGISSSPLNLMLGSGSPVSGQSPAFQMGGPRSIQMSLRLSF